jgi:hypothetical protein
LKEAFSDNQPDLLSSTPFWRTHKKLGTQKNLRFSIVSKKKPIPSAKARSA